MFSLILRRSLGQRKARVAIAVVAVMMGASIASALLMVSLDIRDKVGYEFRSYGANILLVPESESISISIGDVDYGSVTEQSYIDEKDLPKIKDHVWGENVLGYAPYLYSVVYVGDQVAILTGTWFDQVQKISPWWEVEGHWIDDRNDTTRTMVGTTVARILDLELGDTLDIAYNNSGNLSTSQLTVAGIVTTGGSEDNQIFVNLGLAQELTRRQGKVNTVQVSALCIQCPVDTMAATIEEQLPGVEAKTVKQVTTAEMNLLEKLEQLMLLVTALALMASALGVSTTMTSSVMERTTEMGTMKALGSPDSRIALLFLCEGLIIGILGGLLGFGVGVVFAKYLGQSVFSATIAPRLSVALAAIGLSVGVTLAASILPVRRALSIQPALVLRGE